ncbi:zonular occludens toxin domain-containing protein [Sulfurimonas sp.]|uniref:zonular occludens toxin domain-containing protein n=1 Tax=Sulfurimonas sp. TaxID=2022749 RepID=UPI003D12E9F9
MISFFVGVPGSGKTYYAVDKIYNNFSNDKEASKDKKATFENCYTNINEFRFDKVENCFNLDFDELKSTLTKLHKLYKAKATDEELIEFCKEHNILNTLFVIDEAHNFFDVKDVVLIWWLSYHRHLYHEIILITQNLALIDAKYKSFSEFFYKAVPTSLNLFKTHFKYNQFCDSRMSLRSHTTTFKLKKDKKVFELYHSGDSIKSTNIILKIILSVLGLMVFLVLYFYFVVLDKDIPLFDEDNITNQTVLNTSESPQSMQNATFSTVNKNENSVVYLGENSEQYREAKFLILSCNTSICYNNSLSLPVPLITQFIKSKNMNLLYSQSINKNYIKLFISCSEDFYMFLNSISNQGSSKNEEKSFVNGFFPPAQPTINQSR